MARIKWFEVEGIAIYIYGELYEKHHVPHLLIRKSTVESTQYGFDGNPIFRQCNRCRFSFPPIISTAATSPQ